jgi:pimeloyl-ACP methyl ester carboxylesterase
VVVAKSIANVARALQMKHPLVLLPGLLCDATLWQAQVTSLSDVAECWIPPVMSEETIAAMAQAVLGHVPFERFALAGLSMGGYVAMEVMRQVPQRVQALALLDTRAPADIPEETQRRRDLIRLACSAGGFSPVSRRMLPLLVHESRLDDTALVEAVQQMAERTGVEAYVRQQTAVISRPDARGDLARIGVPTLVLCGRQDVLTPLANHEEMAALIPGAELVVIEDCGHLSTMERPDAVSAALRTWLARI